MGKQIDVPTRPRAYTAEIHDDLGEGKSATRMVTVISTSMSNAAVAVGYGTEGCKPGSRVIMIKEIGTAILGAELGAGR